MIEDADTVETPPTAPLPSKAICVAAAVLAALMGAWAGAAYAPVLGEIGEASMSPNVVIGLGVLLGGASGYAVGLWWRRAVARGSSGREGWGTVLHGAALGCVAGCISTLVLHVGLSAALAAVGRLSKLELPGVAWVAAIFLGCACGAVLGGLAGLVFAMDPKREEAAP